MAQARKSAEISFCFPEGLRQEPSVASLSLSLWSLYKLQTDMLMCFMWEDASWPEEALRLIVKWGKKAHAEHIDTGNPLANHLLSFLSIAHKGLSA